MGFCMGGVLTMLAAIHLPEVDAAISWYGVPPEGAGDPGDIDIPLQGHFGEKDSFFPIAQVDKLEEKLKEDEVGYEFYRYAGLNMPLAMKLVIAMTRWLKHKAWERSLDFLDKHISIKCQLGTQK